MVRYVLCCDKDHKLEAWFRSHADCERLMALRIMVCPLCQQAEAKAAARAAARHIQGATIGDVDLLARRTEH